MTGATIFAVMAAALYAAHHVGDYWVQTHHQAMTKAARSRAGQLSCAAHVVTYTATTALFCGVVWAVFALPVTWYGFAAGQLVSALTHYWADRRVYLLGLASRLGKGDFARLGTPRPDRDDNPTLGTGTIALDQSWHMLWLFAAAIVTAVLR
jgi:hypothetical protein